MNFINRVNYNGLFQPKKQTLLTKLAL